MSFDCPGWVFSCLELSWSYPPKGSSSIPSGHIGEANNQCLSLIPMFLSSLLSLPSFSKINTHLLR